MISESLEKEFPFEIRSLDPVRGGNTHRSFCLKTPDKKYFLKINRAGPDSDFFKREAEGLDILKNNSRFKIPQVFKTGTTQGFQYLLTEWIEHHPPSSEFWKDFGSTLADMHLRAQPFFGSETDNYIGTLKQINRKQKHWGKFYSCYRIRPLAERLAGQGQIKSSEMKIIRIISEEMEDIFPAENPALLHGDLWIGNFLRAPDKGPVLIDPAVYSGHREMDIAMSLLFGGFDRAFYDSYQSVYPFQKGWKKRLPLAQLYPLLVHAVLFGPLYTEKVKQNLYRIKKAFRL